ncbi:hypothetical protein L9F63_010739, partial [Diploptera punctata]
YLKVWLTSFVQRRSIYWALIWNSFKNKRRFLSILKHSLEFVTTPLFIIYFKMTVVYRVWLTENLGTLCEFNMMYNGGVIFIVTVNSVSRSESVYITQFVRIVYICNCLRFDAGRNECMTTTWITEKVTTQILFKY